jgi:hypothetical protein
MRAPFAILLAAAALLLAAPGAEAKKLRFKVVSLKGEQTATWHDSIQGGCGTIARNGTQTIAFELLRPGRLSLQRFRRTDPRTGKRRGYSYSGFSFVRANWTFTRSFQQTVPPECPPPLEAMAAQATDCGTKGPFEVPIDIGWRGGALELRGVLARGYQRAPHYESCEYDGFHELDLIDSKGRLSQRRLTSRRRRTIRVNVSERLKEPTAESDGSQTTTLTATVTLKRIR